MLSETKAGKHASWQAFTFWVLECGLRNAKNWSLGVLEQRKDEHRTSNVQHRMLNEKEKKNDERRTIE
jgi:hypothetical protein